MKRIGTEWLASEADVLNHLAGETFYSTCLLCRGIRHHRRVGARLNVDSTDPTQLDGMVSFAFTI